MKQAIVFLSVLLFTYCPTLAQVTCDVFDINSELNKETLSLSLNTDLPDNTVLMVSISRSYWEEGSSDEYSIDYYSERSTVQEWRKGNTITIDNSKWETDLQNKQKELAPLGLGFDVDRISDSVVVRMVVPINQPSPKFGDGNKKLTGKEVNTSGFRTVSDENSIYYTLEGTVAKKSKFADPLSLQVGVAYTISKRTPLMSEFDPSDPMKALENTKEIPSGNLIKVISTRKKDNNPWYEVEVFNNRGNQIGKGWINSQALMGQSLQIKE
tara:strand:- start:136 stop:942 length:807 start_codon:yes stop_codon:yes gene_type:complete